MHHLHSLRRLTLPFVVGTATLALGVAALSERAVAGPAALVAPGNMFPGVFFIHTADSINIAGPVTYINHPLLDGNPDAVFLATQNWNPDGSPGIYNAHDIGAYYSVNGARWGILNESTDTIPNGAAFNVYVPPVGPAAYVHTSTPSNTTFHYTFLDHAQLNDDPQALAFTLRNYNVYGGFFDHSLGVWYTGTRWSIFTQDSSTMPMGVGFNVFAHEVSANTFVHTAAAGNSNGSTTFLSHPLAVGRPNAVIIVTQNWNPGGVGSTFNDEAIGVRYDESMETWGIFNQDSSSMPLGASFNVLIDGEAVFVPLVTH